MKLYIIKWKNKNYFGKSVIKFVTTNRNELRAYVNNLANSYFTDKYSNIVCDVWENDVMICDSGYVSLSRDLNKIP